MTGHIEENTWRRAVTHGRSQSHTEAANTHRGSQSRMEGANHTWRELITHGGSQSHVLRCLGQTGLRNKHIITQTIVTNNFLKCFLFFFVFLNVVWGR